MAAMPPLAGSVTFEAMLAVSTASGVGAGGTVSDMTFGDELVVVGDISDSLGTGPPLHAASAARLGAESERSLMSGG
jgi:hypothetical protein